MRFGLIESAIFALAHATYTLSDFQTKLPWARPKEGFYPIQMGLDLQAQSPGHTILAL
jgi:hypothetical protein